jgi:glycosyltransferase involved in cell wall biosynthesis
VPLKYRFDDNHCQLPRPQLRHVGMFVHTLDDRAVSRLTLAVSAELVRSALQVTLICATRSTAARVQVPDRVRVTNLGLDHKRTAFGLMRLARRLREIQPDVLFAHLNGPVRAAVIARALARVPTRIVAVEHTHYSTFGWKHRHVRDRLMRYLLPRADWICGVSPQVVHDLESLFTGVRGRTSVLPTVAPDSLRKRCAPPDHQWFRGVHRPQIICSVANLYPLKGQDTLVRALHNVREVAGDVRLILVGRFDNQSYLRELQHLAAELSVANAVWFAGYQADSIPFIAHSDAFVLASRSEGCPTVLVEALACGVPAIATTAPGGAAYVLDEGRCGLLVPVDNVPAMAEAMVRLLRDQDLRRVMVERGRERARSFMPEKVAADYIAVANHCCSVAPAAA